VNLKDLPNKNKLTDEELKAIVEARDYLLYKDSNITLESINPAFEANLKLLKERYPHDSIEFDREKRYLISQIEICQEAAKRPRLYEEIIEYEMRVKKENNPLLFYLSGVFEIIQKFLKNVNVHITRDKIKYGVGLAILFLMIVIISIYPTYIIKDWVDTAYLDFKIKFFGNENKVFTGYVSRNFIIAKDRTKTQEVLMIPFGTKLEVRKVEVTRNSFDLYILSLRAYIKEEDLSLEEPVEYRSKILILAEDENKCFIPLDDYKKDIPTNKIEMHYDKFKYIDYTGEEKINGTIQLFSGFILLSNNEIDSVLVYIDKSCYILGDIFYKTKDSRKLE
jgi:hypothetical protein